MSLIGRFELAHSPGLIRLHLECIHMASVTEYMVQLDGYWRLHHGGSPDFAAAVRFNPYLATRRVCIIGAGLYGLATAKVFLHDDSDFFTSVTVLEKQTSVGGVWSPTRIYPGLTTNSPLKTYEFPDFPYPEDVVAKGDHVDAQDVSQYFHQYCETFQLHEHIRLGTEVKDVTWDSLSRVWRISISVSPACGALDGETSPSPPALECEYLVICTGLYQSLYNPFPPHVQPDAATPSKSVIMHSQELGDPDTRDDLLSGRHIVVLGGGKSAVDIATMIAKASEESGDPTREVTLVFPEAHWLISRRVIFGLVKFQWVLFCRLLLAFHPFYVHATSFHSFVANTLLGKFITTMCFYLVSLDILHTTGLGRGATAAVPTQSLRHSLAGAFHVIPNDYGRLLLSGRIKVVLGKAVETAEEGVVVEMGPPDARVRQIVQADRVVLATGYKVTFPFLSNDILELTGMSNLKQGSQMTKPLKLYRFLVPPLTACSPPASGCDSSVPHRNIAFSGFAYTLINPAAAWVGAHWIAEWFRGDIPALSLDQVKGDIDKMYKWQVSSFGERGASGMHLGPNGPDYVDALVKDMRLEQTRSTGLSGTLKYWLSPVLPESYVWVEERRRRKRAAEQGCVES